MNQTPIIRTSLAFASTMTDNDLPPFARNVQTKLYTTAPFTQIPVTELVLGTAITAFTDAKAAQSSGGKAATAEKNNRRAALVSLLRQLAFYVQVVSNNDLAVLLSSGFEAVNSNRSSYPLAKPTLLRITSEMSGQSLLTLSTEKISRGSEVKVAEISEDGTIGEFRPSVFSTSSRNIPISGLVPGRLYAYVGRNMGGATVFSEWSDQVVQRAV